MCSAQLAQPLPTFKKESFATKVNSFQAFFIVAKLSILDTGGGPGYTFVTLNQPSPQQVEAWADAATKLTQ